MSTATKAQTKTQLFARIAELEAINTKLTNAPTESTVNGTLFKGTVTFIKGNHIVMRVNNGHHATLNIELTESQAAGIKQLDRIAVRGFWRESEGDSRTFQNLNGRIERRNEESYVLPVIIGVRGQKADGSFEYRQLIPTTEEAEGRMLKSHKESDGDVNF